MITPFFSEAVRGGVREKKSLWQRSMVRQKSWAEIFCCITARADASMSEAKICFSDRMIRFSRAWSFRRAKVLGLKPGQDSKAKVRKRPGGIPALIMAASREKVPDPAMGSRRMSDAENPAQKSRAKARFSLKGAGVTFSLRPR